MATVWQVPGGGAIAEISDGQFMLPGAGLYSGDPIDTPPTGSISVDDSAINGWPVTGYIGQRINGGATGYIKGRITYTGIPISIQYRVMETDDLTVVQDWATWDSNPSGGVSEKTVVIPTNTAAEPFYHIHFRFSNEHSIELQDDHPVGVGARFIFDGQSQVRKAFKESDAGSPTAAVLQYIDKSWSEPDNAPPSTLGDALVAELDCPVALIVGDSANIGGTSILEHLAGTALMNYVLDSMDNIGAWAECYVWQQGEKNVISPTILTQQQYEDNFYNNADSVLKTIRANVENGSAFDELPAYITILGRLDHNAVYPSATDEVVEAIRDAERNIIATFPDCYFAAECITLDNLDEVHYDEPENDRLYDWIAQAILYSMGLVSYGAGPVASRAVKVDATHIDVFFAHRGGTDLTATGTTNPNGWEVFDKGAQVSVSTKTYQSATCYRLNLAAPLTGNDWEIEVRYLYGATGRGNVSSYAQAFLNEILDNSALAMPVMSFNGMMLGVEPSTQTQSPGVRRAIRVRRSDFSSQKNYEFALRAALSGAGMAIAPPEQAQKITKPEKKSQLKKFKVVQPDIAPIEIFIMAIESEYE